MNLIFLNSFLKWNLNSNFELTHQTEKVKDLHTEAKVPSIEEYVGKLQANFNIRLKILKKPKTVQI